MAGEKDDKCRSPDDWPFGALYTLSAGALGNDRRTGVAQGRAQGIVAASRFKGPTWLAVDLAHYPEARDVSSPLEAELSAQAVVHWGHGGGRHQVRVDWRHGTRLHLHGDAVDVALDFAISTGWEQSRFVATIAPSEGGRTLATLSQRLQFEHNDDQIFPVPEWANAVGWWPIAGGADVSFLGGPTAASALLGTTDTSQLAISTAGRAPVITPGNAQFVLVEPGGNGVNGTLVWEIGL